MEIANLVVALGNVYPIIYMILYIKALSGYSVFLITGNATVSFLMHLAETEHGRVGIYPFCFYFREFLFLNTIFTTTSAFLTIYIAYLKETLTSLLFYGSIAATNILLAEHRFQNNKILWIICHSIWHIICYHLLVSTFLVN